MEKIYSTQKIEGIIQYDTINRKLEYEYWNDLTICFDIKRIPKLQADFIGVSTTKQDLESFDMILTENFNTISNDELSVLKFVCKYMCVENFTIDKNYSFVYSDRQNFKNMFEFVFKILLEFQKELSNFGIKDKTPNVFYIAGGWLINNWAKNNEIKIK